jgi:hypothetical protein
MIFQALVLSFANIAYGQTTSSKEVSVVNTPNVNVVNVPTVGIDATHNLVRLPNTQADPLAVTVVGDAVRRPFQVGVNVLISPGGNADFTRIEIPAGKRLVIEDVSAVTFQPEGQGLLLNFVTGLEDLVAVTGQDEFETHNVILVSQGLFNGLERSVAHQKMLVFAEQLSGVGIILQMSRGSVTGTAGARVTFSGYVEDLPTTAVVGR